MFTFVLIATCAVTILWYLYHKLTYWQRKGVPTPGLIYQWNYYTRELGPYDQELEKQYGSVYGIMEGLVPTLLVSDPDLIRDILVKDFASFPNHKPFRIGSSIVDLNLFALEGNEDWKRIRSLLSPTFTTGKLRSMDSIVNNCIDVLKKNLGTVAQSGELIDAKKYFNSLAFDVLSRCAYGTHIESLNDPHNPIQKNFETVFSGKWEMLFSMFFPRVAKMTGIQKLALEPLTFFITMTQALIDERSRVMALENGSRETYNDFLQIMLDANEEAKKELGTNAKEAEAVGTTTQQLKKTLSTEEMMAQSMIFLLAGFDTTASILSCASYHLAKNPLVQDKLAAEVSVLAEYNHDSAMNLKYMDAVLRESFRLSPPVIRVERQCVSETMIGDVKVEPGNIVAIPVYAVHRDGNQYENPEEFNPERWLGEEAKQVHQYSYLPFGGGPRMCIAQRFALMEVKLTLAKILKDFKFVATPDTKLGYTPASFNSLAPRPLMMKVQKL